MRDNTIKHIHISKVGGTHCLECGQQLPQSTIDSELREKLAAIEHERWADWQKWCHKILRANIKHDIEPTLARWEKQIATPYHKLTRPEQLSDLEQVDRYWPLIEQYIAQEANKAQLAILERLSCCDHEPIGDKAEINVCNGDHLKLIEALTADKEQADG